MEVIQILLDIIVGIIIFYLGTVEKRIGTMQAKLDKKIDTEEVERVVELEIKAVANEQANLKEGLVRIETKLDKLLDKVTVIK